MKKSQQTADNVQVGGSIKQQSTSEDAKQDVRNATVGGGIDQHIDGQETGLQIGNAKAYGRIGVIVLGVIVVVWLIVRMLS